MEEANARLMERLASVKSKHNAVLSEAQALNSDLRAKSTQNEMLQAQVRQLLASLPVCPPVTKLHNKDSSTPCSILCSSL